MTPLLRRSARTLAAASVLPAALLLPQAVVAAPTVAFTAPAEGGALSGNVQGPPHCVVTGSNIRRVMFYLNGQWTNTDGNLSNGLGCWIDTTKYKDGTYTLTAVAYDAAGATATARRTITIRNNAPSGPTISWQAPAEGGTLSGNVQGPPHCIVTGTNIARVMFYLNGQWTNTDGNLDNGLGCWIDTTKYPNGTYTVKAIAYSADGKTAEASRSIRIENGGGSSPSPAGPTISWKAPAEGGTLSGNVQGPPHCVVTGSNIRRVMFYLNGQWTNTDGNLDNGLGCWIDTTKYKDGTYTLKAVAYDANGKTAEASRSIVIRNASAPANKPPSVAIMSPQAGATLSGMVNSTSCVADARDDKAVAKVDFYVGNTLVTSKSAAPYQCAIDTTRFADGNHTLMAVATDSDGATATAQRSVTIKNGSGDSGGDGGGSAIDSADILGWASGDVPFSQQSGYSAQVLGTYPSASSIPEGGIHGFKLPNGETIRLGKAVDPTNSAKKALVFQLHPNDPATSGSKRAEIKFPKNIEFDKTYWIAYKVFVKDWGTLASNDAAIFGTQLHSGDNSKGYSPSFGVYTKGGKTFHIEVRGSGTSGTLRYAEQPIPFGRWVDFVFKVRQSTGGSGLLQAWVDGRQVVNYSGPIGYKTAEKDYMKFGYYNWSGAFNSARKVMLRTPLIVRDPTGSKYDAATLRAYINK